MSDYTASNIRILSEHEACVRWTWASATKLAVEFKRPQQWIEKGLRACEAAGVDHAYFIDRYLRRREIPRNVAVEEAYRELTRPAR